MYGGNATGGRGVGLGNRKSNNKTVRVAGLGGNFRAPIIGARLTGKETARIGAGAMNPVRGRNLGGRGRTAR